jgi:hypothetical protein
MSGTRWSRRGTKSDACQRTLPAPAPVHRALPTFRTLQAKEKLLAGEAYEDSGHILVDELGRPWKTNKPRREAYKLMELAEVQKVRLYDARHACLSWRSCPNSSAEQDPKWRCGKCETNGP